LDSRKIRTRWRFSKKSSPNKSRWFELADSSLSAFERNQTDAEVVFDRNGWVAGSFVSCRKLADIADIANFSCSSDIRVAPRRCRIATKTDQSWIR
jgi:hypothetical protein